MALLSQRMSARASGNDKGEAGIDRGFALNLDYNPQRYREVYDLGSDIQNRSFSEADAERFAQAAGAAQKSAIVRGEALKNLRDYIAATVKMHTGDLAHAEQLSSQSMQLHAAKNRTFNTMMDNAFKGGIINHQTRGAIQGYSQQYSVRRLF